jgi:hypothetical protein
MADCFGWADYWTHALKKLGYEVWEPVGNAEPMQKAWAREKGVNYYKESWLLDIVNAQIKYFQPDILFVNDYSTYTASFFKRLRDECPSIRLVIGWCGAPYTEPNVFKEYDLVISNIPNLVESFRENGSKSIHMCHAFEPRILKRINKNSVERNTGSFIGSINKTFGFHNRREKLLKKIAKETNFQIFSNISKPSLKNFILLIIKSKIHDIMRVARFLPCSKLFSEFIPKINNFSQIKYRPSFFSYFDTIISNISQPGLFGIQMYQKIYESLVALNTHIDLSSLYASNMRLFEATGVGSCLLTERQENLKELFEPEAEVVTYRTDEEAVEKINYLLSNENECRKIALAGQKRTLENHTFDIRAKQLDQIIRQNI